MVYLNYSIKFSVKVSVSVDVASTYLLCKQLLYIGSAYIFHTTDGGLSWSETQIIIPTSGAASDYFGYDVSMCGDAFIVGAVGKYNFTGIRGVYKK